jgi:glycosyltransferase involved in cell wall biosynthesis
MRILQVIHDFVPRHVAGSELYCYYLSGALAARGHAVHVLFTEFDCARPQYTYRRSRLDMLTCHEVVHNHEYRSFEDTYVDARMEERFERLLDEERPNVVHLHHLLHHSLNYPKIARRRGIPVVFTLHDYWLSCLNYGQRLHPSRGVCDTVDIALCADCVSRFPALPPFAPTLRRWATRARRRPPRADAEPTALRSADPTLGRRAKAIYRGLMRRLTPAAWRMVHAARRLEAIRAAWRDVDLFLAPSAFLAERMIEFGLPAERVAHSSNGMRTDLLHLQRRVAAGRIRIGYVGSVAPHKGVHVLIEAFTALATRRSGPPIELRIHGNLAQFPAYVAGLRALAGSAPVSFLGQFDNARASEVYAEIDVLVIPSIWWENAPLTLFEAHLAGRPVIVSDCGSLPDLIDARDMVFRSGDTRDLARCLQAFAERPRLVATSTAHLHPIKTMEQDAREMERRYAALIAALSPPQGQAIADDGRP